MTSAKVTSAKHQQIAAASDQRTQDTLSGSLHEALKEVERLREELGRLKTDRDRLDFIEHKMCDIHVHDLYDGTIKWTVAPKNAPLAVGYDLRTIIDHLIVVVRIANKKVELAAGRRHRETPDGNHPWRKGYQGLRELERRTRQRPEGDA